MVRSIFSSWICSIKYNESAFLYFPFIEWIIPPSRGWVREVVLAGRYTGVIFFGTKSLWCQPKLSRKIVPAWPMSLRELQKIWNLSRANDHNLNVYIKRKQFFSDFCKNFYYFCLQHWGCWWGCCCCCCCCCCCVSYIWFVVSVV